MAKAKTTKTADTKATSEADIVKRMVGTFRNDLTIDTSVDISANHYYFVLLKDGDKEYYATGQLTPAE